MRVPINAWLFPQEPSHTYSFFSAAAFFQIPVLSISEHIGSAKNFINLKEQPHVSIEKALGFQTADTLRLGIQLFSVPLAL
jgi:hypothetical protein